MTSAAQMLAKATAEGLLPEDATLPNQETRPWPVVLLTALGAVDSIPLEGIDACVAPAPEDGAGQGVSEGPRCYDYGPGTDFGARAILTHSGRPIVDFLYETHHLYSLDGVRANHFLQQLRLDLLAPVKGPLGVGFSAEYFDRRTYFSQTLNPTQKFHYPQVRLFMTWRFS